MFFTPCVHKIYLFLFCFVFSFHLFAHFATYIIFCFAPNFVMWSIIIYFDKMPDPPRPVQTNACSFAHFFLHLLHLRFVCNNIYLCAASYLRYYTIITIIIQRLLVVLSSHLVLLIIVIVRNVGLFACYDIRKNIYF